MAICQIDVRLVTKEVPVVLQAIHDNIVEVPQVEYIEVVKEIPKVEVRYVEKTVEVPKIEYATWRNGLSVCLSLKCSNRLKELN